jgi:dihydroneopterin aldolase
MSVQRILADQLTEQEGSAAIVLPEEPPLTRVFVRDLVVEASIGVYEHEHRRTQRVRFNVDLYARLPQGGPRRDALEEVVSYERIVDGIRALVASDHVNLVETMAERVATQALQEPRVAAARVRVEKLDVYGGAAVGVEIERRAAPAQGPGPSGQKLLRILSAS